MTQPVQPRAVRDFQEMFAHIYTDANKKYDDKDLILRLAEEISVIMELARKDDLEELPGRIVCQFSWLNAVATRFKIDLQDALWHKYPNVCPYCLRKENCCCAVEHPDIPDKQLQLRRLRLETHAMPTLLSEHQDLHRRLYAKQNRRILMIQTAAHLAEEVGEFSKEVRHNNLQGMCDELSDMVSWDFALANRLYPSFELAETAWRQYPYECEKCHQAPCIDECSDLPLVMTRHSTVVPPLVRSVASNLT